MKKKSSPYVLYDTLTLLVQYDSWRLGSVNGKCVSYSLFLPLKTYKLGKSETTFVEVLVSILFAAYITWCMYKLVDFLPEQM